jgi:serine/threonine protein kinase
MAFTIPINSFSFHQKLQKFVESNTASSRTVAPVIRFTLGLETLFEKISATRHKEIEKKGQVLTDDASGFLKFPSQDDSPSDSFVLDSRYRLIRLIGQGTFAQLIEAEDQYSVHPKRRVAIKIIRAGMTQLGLQESSLHFTLAREKGFGFCNIVHPISSFQFRNHFCLVMELFPASLKDLMHCVRPSSIPASKIRKLSYQICTALYFLRTKGVIHADIRPENILITSLQNMKVKWKIKLADFGNSFLTHFRRVYYDDFNVQTLTYRSPEVLFGLPFDSQIGSLFHIWSFFVYY